MGIGVMLTSTKIHSFKTSLRNLVVGRRGQPSDGPSGSQPIDKCFDRASGNLEPIRHLLVGVRSCTVVRVQESFERFEFEWFARGGNSWRSCLSASGTIIARGHRRFFLVSKTRLARIDSVVWRPPYPAVQIPFLLLF
jgi:hypothetical protein